MIGIPYLRKLNRSFSEISLRRSCNLVTRRGYLLTRPHVTRSESGHHQCPDPYCTSGKHLIKVHDNGRLGNPRPTFDYFAVIPYLRRISRTRSIGIDSTVMPFPVMVVAIKREL